MKIKIECEIDIKKLVEEDFACLDDEILNSSIEDIKESIADSDDYRGSIVDYIDDKTIKAIHEEYIKLAYEKVGIVQLSLFD